MHLYSEVEVERMLHPDSSLPAFSEGIKRGSGQAKTKSPVSPLQSYVCCGQSRWRLLERPDPCFGKVGSLVPNKILTQGPVLSLCGGGKRGTKTHSHMCTATALASDQAGPAARQPGSGPCCRPPWPGSSSAASAASHVPQKAFAVAAVAAGPSAQRHRSRPDSREPCAGRSPHLRAWPRRWACGRSRAWPGSFCPPIRAALRRRGVTRGEGRRRSAVPSLAHSFIRARAVRGWGLRAKGPQARRAERLRGAARAPPRIRRGGIGIAGSRGPAHTQRAQRTASAPPPRPSRNRKSPCSPRHHDFRNNRKQNSTAWAGGAGSACAVPAAPSGGGRPAGPRCRRSV